MRPGSCSLLFKSCLLSLLALPAAAQNRAVMEGTPTSNKVLYVSTTSRIVVIDTITYRGGISGTGLYVASNVVVSAVSTSNSCVIYATGNVACVSFSGSGAALTGISSSDNTKVAKAGDTMTGALVMSASSVTLSGTAGVVSGASSGTFSAVFGDGSHLTSISSETSVNLVGALFTNTTLGPCMSGSTISITVPDNTTPVHVWFNGSVAAGSTHESALSFLVDGVFAVGLSSSIAAATPSPISSQCMGAFYDYRIASLSAGSHRFCFTAANNTGAVGLTVMGSGFKCTYENIWTVGSQFGVRFLYH